MPGQGKKRKGFFEEEKKGKPWAPGGRKGRIKNNRPVKGKGPLREKEKKKSKRKKGPRPGDEGKRKSKNIPPVLKKRGLLAFVEEGGIADLQSEGGKRREGGTRPEEKKRCLPRKKKERPLPCTKEEKKGKKRVSILKGRSPGTPSRVK